MFSFNKIIRYINQNKKKILIIIAAIAGLIIVIQFLNGVAGSMLNSGTGSSENISAKNEKVYQPNKTVFGNTVIKENTAKDNNEIIDKFIKFCINGEIEEKNTKNKKEILGGKVETNKVKNQYDNINNAKIERHTKKSRPILGHKIDDNKHKKEG